MFSAAFLFPEGASLKRARGSLEEEKKKADWKKEEEEDTGRDKEEEELGEKEEA